MQAAEGLGSSGRGSSQRCRWANASGQCMRRFERAPLLLVGGGLGSGLQAGDLAVGGDALARRERDVAAGAVALAEAALDAAVHDRARGRARLQVLQVRVRVLIRQPPRCGQHFSEQAWTPPCRQAHNHVLSPHRQPHLSKHNRRSYRQMQHRMAAPQHPVSGTGSTGALSSDTPGSAGHCAASTDGAV